MRKLVVWGGIKGLESHRWIHRGFVENARKMGMSALWVDDIPTSVKVLEPGVTVISADIYGKHLIPAVGVDYVLHNFDADHLVCKTVEPENILRLQVWTHDAYGETWDEYRQYSAEAHTLFQPWGTDILAEEFMDPAFNPFSREIVLVGAIWGEASEAGELGNVAAIDELREVVREKGFTLKHLTHVTNPENVNAVRTSRLAPAIAGGWQVEHGYLPCRAFKNSSYGALMLSNVPTVNTLYRAETYESTEGLIDYALRLKKGELERLVREQQRVTARYTYRQSLEAIFRALDTKL